MELPEDQSKGNEIDTMSEIQLLKLYAEQARSRDGDGYKGFYLEEMPSRFPRTKLFRLPAKWAHEFVLRKNNREDWNDEVEKEYSFFTRHDFTKALKNFGLRILYSAPHWDDQLIQKRFVNKIRLFDAEGTPLGAPETSFVFVVQKADNKTSLTLQERKPFHGHAPHLQITAMRNEFDGSLHDIVSRDMHLTEILPYRVTASGKLHVFVHEGVPRGLSNTVPRKGPNIDGKQWSGHMTEAISVQRDFYDRLDESNIRQTMNFAEDGLGLKPEVGELFEGGPGFFPAPDCIDEHINTKYLRVKAPQGLTPPKVMLDEADGFSTRGRIRELDAQQILNAVSVGFVASSRLELQILGLYEKLQISYQSWSQCPLNIEIEEEVKTTKRQEIIANMAKDDNRFKETKGTAGQIKAMQSVFVDEGRDNGGVTGLASREMDFVMNEELSMNTAVVLPLARKSNGEVMAGIVEQYLPVPQRYKGSGYMLNCPSFSLPVEVDNFEKARRFIAEQFSVPVECVARMGESFFSHIGVTPQRIYPFAVTPKKVSGWRADGRVHGMTQYAPLYRLYRLLYWDNSYSFMKIVAMTYQAALGADSDLSADVSFNESHEARKDSFVGMSDASYDYDSKALTPLNGAVDKNEPSNDG